MDYENITLKPLPPQIYNCSACKNQFLSRLRVNGKFYRSCDDCRNKSLKQGKRYRESHIKLK